MCVCVCVCVCVCNTAYIYIYIYIYMYFKHNIEHNTVLWLEGVLYNAFFSKMTQGSLN